jgi:TRAP-type C4-dicarboxylate transport system permease small subunit
VKLPLPDPPKLRSRRRGDSTLIDRLERINSAVAVALFAALVVVVTLQVVTRFVLHFSVIWSEEVARFLFFWVVLLGAALGVRRRRHFVIDIVSGHTAAWGRAGRLLFDIIPDVCVLAFTAMLIVQGMGYAQSGLLRNAPNSGVNMALVYGAIPLFAALSVLYSVTGLARDISAFRQGLSADLLSTEGAE